MMAPRPCYRWREDPRSERNPPHVRPRVRLPAGPVEDYTDLGAEGLSGMTERVSLSVNGTAHEIVVDDPSMPLLYALRDELGFSNPRFGCGLGQCGACTVHLDGVAVRSCQIPVARVGAKEITTLAGLGTPEKPNPIQTAWIAEQVNQCGYCINGWIMTAAALLARNPHPTDDEIKTALAPLICRCGTHGAALRAVKRAAKGT
jgi:nicotinate dehydrogenase subunit A